MSDTRIHEVQTDDQIIDRALHILLTRMKKPLFIFESAKAIQQYVRLKMGLLPYEVFAVFFFDARHGLIACDEMFRGTLMSTSIHPREVLKRAMELNAASVVLAHNHPSGVSRPSRCDEHITSVLKTALALVDVRVLDHLVVCVEDVSSMAEMGLM